MRHVAGRPLGDAEELCRLVLTRSPNHPEAWMVLGKGLIGERRWSEAEVVLAHGCSLSPGLAELHAALGQLYLELHRFGDAMGPIENCVLLDPAAGKERATLVAILRHARLCDVQRAVESGDDRLPGRPGSDAQPDAACLVEPVAPRPGRGKHAGAPRRCDYESFCALATEDRLSSWEASAFVSLGLRRFLVADPAFERGLTLARRWFLQAGPSADRHLPLLCTLARYCL